MTWRNSKNGIPIRQTSSSGAVAQPAPGLAPASYEQLTYNTRGLVTRRRGRAARLIDFGYDNAGRLLSTSYNSYGTGETPVYYSYDGLGRETRAERTDPEYYDQSVIVTTYDGLSRRATETQGSSGDSILNSREFR